MSRRPRRIAPPGPPHVLGFARQILNLPGPVAADLSTRRRRRHTQKYGPGREVRARPNRRGRPSHRGRAGRRMRGRPSRRGRASHSHRARRTAPRHRYQPGATPAVTGADARTETGGAVWEWRCRRRRLRRLGSAPRVRRGPKASVFIAVSPVMPLPRRRSRSRSHGPRSDRSAVSTRAAINGRLLPDSLVIGSSYAVKTQARLKLQFALGLAALGASAAMARTVTFGFSGAVWPRGRRLFGADHPRRRRRASDQRQRFHYRSGFGVHPKAPIVLITPSTPGDESRLLRHSRFRRRCRRHPAGRRHGLSN